MGDGSPLLGGQGYQTPIPNYNSPAPLPPVSPTLRAIADRNADLAIANMRVSSIPGWDWKPFLMAAIYERADTPADALPTPPSGSSSLGESSVQLGGNNASCGPHQFKSTRWTPPPKPADESWDHIWYTPEWTHPNWDPAYQLQVDGSRKRRVTTRDIMTRLRPALRPEDAVRNPTEYAKRWGIHMDQRDGRSRLSPTFALTRPIHMDDQTILNMLPQNAIDQIVQVTQAAVRSGQISAPQGGANIAPEIFAQWKQQNGIMPPEIFREGARAYGLPFETFVDMLPENTKHVYRNVIQGMLDDQDYQRFMFKDLTTDELIQRNIHTMASDYYCDLSGPLHPLVARDKWEDTSYRGVEGYPRYLYQLDGKRMEWDVNRNDDLWMALQPALQMVSRVLRANPPFWQAIKDLRTRQPIDESLDRRPEPREPEFLTCMCRLEDIDVDKCYAPIAELARQGFDFCSHADRTLYRHLTLSFVAGNHDHNFAKDTEWAYGRTGCNYAGPDSRISVMISPEAVWPLLVREYSVSEKLCCSFFLAVTVLHEIMHATHNAVELMTSHEPGIQPADQPCETTALLNEFYDDIVDWDTQFGEPYWKKNIWIELGHAFEFEYFGFTPQTTLDDSEDGVSKFVTVQPLICIGDRQPQTQYRGASSNLVGAFPVDDWSTAIPIDFYERFFRNDFWAKDFVKWGHAAMKMRDPDTSYFGLMLPQWSKVATMRAILGADDYRFFKGVTDILSNYGNSVLGAYLKNSMWEIVGYPLMVARWIRDLASYQAIDANLADEVQSWADEMAHAITLTAYLRFADVTTAYNDWCMFNTAPPGQIAQDWYDTTLTVWTQTFQDGGLLLHRLAEIHRLLQDETRIFERIVFEMFTLAPRMRKLVRQPRLAGNPLPELIKRCMRYRDTAARIHGNITNGPLTMPELASEEDVWQTWAQRFDARSQYFEYLRSNLEDMDSIDETKSKEIRQGLRSVPTSLWMRRSRRLKNMAMREYTLADVRIRDAIDEFMRRLGTKGQNIDPVGIARVDDPNVDDILNNWDSNIKTNDDRWTAVNDNIQHIERQGIYDMSKWRDRINDVGQRPVVFDPIQQVEPGNGVLSSDGNSAPKTYGTGTGGSGIRRRSSAVRVFGQPWNPGRVLKSVPPPRDHGNSTFGALGSRLGNAFTKYISDTVNNIFDDNTSKFASTINSNTSVSSAFPPPGFVGGSRIFPFGAADLTMTTADLRRIQPTTPSNNIQGANNWRSPSNPKTP